MISAFSQETVTDQLPPLVSPPNSEPFLSVKCCCWLIMLLCFGILSLLLP